MSYTFPDGCVGDQFGRGQVWRRQGISAAAAAARPRDAGARPKGRRPPISLLKFGGPPMIGPAPLCRRASERMEGHGPRIACPAGRCSVECMAFTLPVAGCSTTHATILTRLRLQAVA